MTAAVLESGEGGAVHADALVDVDPHADAHSDT